MDFFDRHKALIITLLLFGILFLALYNFNLSNSNQKAREFLVDLENFRTEEEVEEEPEPEEEPQETRQTSVQTHRAFNQEEEARESNFDEQLNEIFERNSAAREETTEDETSESSGDVSLNVPRPKEKTRERSDGDNSSNQTSTRTGGIDNSSITFSLQGRTAVSIPNPIYTCDRSGKVVVNITVNEQGRVTSTSINKASSTTRNECLTEQAMEYASQAVFSSLAGRNSQPGTITYMFKP